MYQIELDRERDLIAVTLGGMMSVDEVNEYMTELRAQFRRHGFEAGYRILVDCGDCTIQSQDMIATMGQRMASFPKAGRIAMVSASALARMQIKRLMTQPYCQVFEDRGAALDWVLQPFADAA